MRDIKVSDREAGQRLDKYLKKYLSEAGSGFIYKMLRKKNILLNGKKASGSELINSGDSVRLYLADDTIDKFTGKKTADKKTDADSAYHVKIALKKDDTTGVVNIICDNYMVDILYEDEDVIFFNKPAGLLSQKASEDDISLVDIFGEYMRLTSKDELKDSGGYRPGICNRLDRNTSGIVAAGKSVIGLQALSYMIKNREVSKFYRCIVHGNITKEGYLKGYLVKDAKQNKVYLSEEDVTGEGQYIETKFRPLSASQRCSLLEVQLITGKTHQIRAHMSSIGHPIVGDVKYGAVRDNNLNSQLLHAYELSFKDTISVSHDGAKEVYNKVFSKLAGKSIIAPLPVIYERYMGTKQGGIK